MYVGTQFCGNLRNGNSYLIGEVFLVARICEAQHSAMHGPSVADITSAEFIDWFKPVIYAILRDITRLKMVPSHGGGNVGNTAPAYLDADRRDARRTDVASTDEGIQLLAKEHASEATG